MQVLVFNLFTILFICV
jgi:hypothetical protein